MHRQVDPDTVFFPDRLRLHVSAHQDSLEICAACACRVEHAACARSHVGSSGISMWIVLPRCSTSPKSSLRHCVMVKRVASLLAYQRCLSLVCGRAIAFCGQYCLHGCDASVRGVGSGRQEKGARGLCSRLRDHVLAFFILFGMRDCRRGVLMQHALSVLSAGPMSLGIVLSPGLTLFRRPAFLLPLSAKLHANWATS